MINKKVLVQPDKEDARELALLVQTASQFKSTIHIGKDNQTVNAKSIMGMMTMGLVPGTSLDVSIDGEDEEAAMEKIESFLSGK